MILDSRVFQKLYKDYNRPRSGWGKFNWFSVISCSYSCMNPKGTQIFLRKMLLEMSYAAAVWKRHFHWLLIFCLTNEGASVCTTSFNWENILRMESLYSILEIQCPSTKPCRVYSGSPKRDTGCFYSLHVFCFRYFVLVKHFQGCLFKLKMRHDQNLRK